ncbi:hypothetical protein ACFOHS_20570 [Jhaorihella thermophila]
MLPVLMGLGLFVLGVVALTHLLRPVRAEDIVDQIRATPWSVLFQAGAATLAAYLALIGYDWSALRYLGKSIPLRIVAVGGFLGYSFGNTVGVSILSGGAVRYRIYSAFGLSALEVASVSTFVALAFGIGITVIGLGGGGAASRSVAGARAPARRTRSLGRGGVAGGTDGGDAVAVGLGPVAALAQLRDCHAAPRPAAGAAGLHAGRYRRRRGDAFYVLLPEGAPEFATFLALFHRRLHAGGAEPCARRRRRVRIHRHRRHARRGAAGPGRRRAAALSRDLLPRAVRAGARLCRAERSAAGRRFRHPPDRRGARAPAARHAGGDRRHARAGGADRLRRRYLADPRRTDARSPARPDRPRRPAGRDPA